MHFAIFGNDYQSEKSKNIDILFTSMDKWGDSFIIDRSFYTFLLKEGKLPSKKVDIIENDDFCADVAISLGGDGTFLRAASHIGRKDIPMIGVNTGRLGFLATVESLEISKMIDYIHEGRYVVKERGLLGVNVVNAELSTYPFALNEVAVMKHDSSSMITIETTINDKHVITYQADGLIVATPSGSTAYSLSVGGPIISPDTNLFVITPIAPHSLNARPLVVQEETRISLQVKSRSNNFLIAVDGRNESCPQEAIVNLEMAPYRQRIIYLEGSSFFGNLKEKMMWGADMRL